MSINANSSASGQQTASLPGLAAAFTVLEYCRVYNWSTGGQYNTLIQIVGGGSGGDDEAYVLLDTGSGTTWQYARNNDGDGYTQGNLGSLGKPTSTGALVCIRRAATTGALTFSIMSDGSSTLTNVGTTGFTSALTSIRFLTDSYGAQCENIDARYIRIFDRELSDAEVIAEGASATALAANLHSSFPANAPANWGNDVSGNGRNLTLTGTAVDSSWEPSNIVGSTPTAPAAQLKTQVRAKGFPPRAPLPGIARIGLGILAAVAPTATPAGTASAATQPFGASAVGTVSFPSVGSVAVPPFAVAGAASGPAVATPAIMAQPQPRTYGFGLRYPGPPRAVLGQGLLAPGVVAAPSSSGSAASSPFGVTASGLLTFSAVGIVAASPFAASSAVAETFSGSASAAVSPFACTGAALETYSCSGSAAMSRCAVTGAAAEAFSCSGGAAASPFAASAVGAEAFSCTITAAASPFAVSGSGALGVTFTSSGTAAMSPCGVSGAAAETFSCTATAARPPFAAAAVSSEAFSCTATAASSPFGCSGNAASGTVFTCVGTAALPPPATSSAGAEAFTGVGAAARPPFATSSAGTEGFAGTAGAALPPFGATGAAASAGAVSGVAAAALSSFGAAALGLEAFTSAGAAACLPFGAGAVLAEAFTGVATSACAPFGATGSGDLGPPSFSCSVSVACSPFGALAAGALSFTCSGEAAFSAFDAIGGQPPVPVVLPAVRVRLVSVAPHRFGTRGDIVMHEMKRTDTLPLFRVVLVNALDRPLNLTGATDLRFTMRRKGATLPTVDSAVAVLEDAAHGLVRYDWAAGETDIAGTYECDFSYQFNGRQQTHPNTLGKLLVRIYPLAGDP